MRGRYLSAAGYLILSLCGASQWIHMLNVGSAQGVSGLFLALFAAGLVLLQMAMRLEQVQTAYQVGNALGLANAVAMLGIWWWVR